MSGGTVWIEERENAVPKILFVAWGRVVAGVFLGDDGKLYFAASRPVSSMLSDVLLSTTFLDPSKKKVLVFSAGGKRRRAVGYALADGERAIGLFTEFAKMLVWAVFDQKVVVKHVGRRAVSVEVPPADVSAVPEKAEELYELRLEGVEEEAEKESEEKKGAEGEAA